MSKNEIHARISPELMERLKRICDERGSNLSDIVRAALVLYVDAYDLPYLSCSCEFLKSENNLEIGLTGASLKTMQTTPDLLDELTSHDIIDW